jgi:2-desacetyl-2-hydroxyethyl bacteriochlorophyllide A dehydrogenase
MQAIVFPSPEHISFERVPDPTCAADEVVVKIAQSGICGTDLHIYKNEYMSKFPLIPGHEFCGSVVELGRDVQGFKIGDRVAVDPNISCGECEFCRALQPNHCLNWRGVGVTQPGGFAEFVAAPARVTYKIPDSLSDAQAAFIEPLACVVHAFNRLRVNPGDDVLLFGAGPMGLLLVQALRHSGAAKVVVVDKQPHRSELARAMGASHTVSAYANASDDLRALAAHGFHIVIDATGAPAVIERALDYLRPRGQYLQFGVAPIGKSVAWEPYRIFKNDWTIIGSFALSFTFQPAMAWLQNGVIDIEPLVSHTLPMSEFVTGFHQFAEGKTLKVHVRPD